jgi:hypothetical protein
MPWWLVTGASVVGTTRHAGPRGLHWSSAQPLGTIEFFLFYIILTQPLGTIEFFLFYIILTPSSFYSFHSKLLVVLAFLDT